MTEREKKLLDQVEKLVKSNAALTKENTLLREKVDLLIRKLFGSKSEKIDPAQLELLLEGLAPKKPQAADAQEDAPAADDLNLPPSKKPARKERKPRLPEHLPVEDTILDPEEVKANPGAWRQIGQEITEQLDYHPGRFTRKRLIRRKYVPRHALDGAPLIAKLPQSLQEACLATPALIAEIIANKYGQHLPFYRQEQSFKQRFGVEISRQNMINWEALACDWLKPLYHLTRRSLLGTDTLQADETPIRYLEPGTGKSHQGYLWAYRDARTGTQFFDWKTTRASTSLSGILQADEEAKRTGLSDFQGILQSDGYSGYQAYAKTHPGIELAACWAHARRKFDEAKTASPRITGWILRQIGLLYQIEARLRETRAGPALREAIRQSQSVPIYNRIGKALEKLKPRYLPQSLLGKAIQYTLGLWPRLGIYLGNGRVEIDNNLTENAIRPTAIGKKNWLFFGSADSGWKAALIFTLAGNCKRLGIDFHAYLKDVLERLPAMTNHQVHQLLPENWLKEKQAATRLAS